ncbi:MULTISPECIES: hypothetical protein [unclassified Streptomyces]|uniref:hypothetical protein n=1 Tax=unclassified Streptomyces TaxID=2593676 RepID=UPI00382EFCC2
MTAILPTRDGGTVTVTRRGRLVDMHVRDAEGRTVATVVRPADQADTLLSVASRLQRQFQV